MMKYANEATKQSADSGVASVALGVCRVGSAREAFRSTSSGRWAVSRREELDRQPEGLDNGKTL